MIKRWSRKIKLRPTVTKPPREVVSLPEAPQKQLPYIEPQITSDDPDYITDEDLLFMEEQGQEVPASLRSKATELTEATSFDSFLAKAISHAVKEGRFTDIRMYHEALEKMHAAFKGSYPCRLNAMKKRGRAPINHEEIKIIAALLGLTGQDFVLLNDRYQEWIKHCPFNPKKQDYWKGSNGNTEKKLILPYNIAIDTAEAIVAQLHKERPLDGNGKPPLRETMLQKITLSDLLERKKAPSGLSR